jgi:hypothetical protein
MLSNLVGPLYRPLAKLIEAENFPEISEVYFFKLYSIVVLSNEKYVSISPDGIYEHPSRHYELEDLTRHHELRCQKRGETWQICHAESTI